MAGQEDPECLAHLAHGSLVKKQDQLQAALQGKLTAHHRVLLEELLPLIATLDRSIARLDREIAGFVAKIFKLNKINRVFASYTIFHKKKCAAFTRFTSIGIWNIFDFAEF